MHIEGRNNESNYYIQVFVVKDNEIIMKNEKKKDQVGKNGKFRHYIDIYLNLK